jgi:hypothetical protein
MRQRADNVIGFRHRREHSEHSAQYCPMGFFGEGRTAIIRNRYVITAINRVARGALHHAVGGNAGQHKMGDTLRAENCLQGACIKGADAGFGNYDVTRMTLDVRMDFGALGTVFKYFVLLHARQDWRVLRRVGVIRAIGMAHMDNRHSHVAPSLG